MPQGTSGQSDSHALPTVPPSRQLHPSPPPRRKNVTSLQTRGLYGRLVLSLSVKSIMAVSRKTGVLLANYFKTDMSNVELPHKRPSRQANTAGQAERQSGAMQERGEGV